MRKNYNKGQVNNNLKLALVVLMIVSSTISTVFSNPQKELQKWGGRLPNKIGCKNGTLIWEQISSSRMINQDKIWSDYKTTAKVHLILSLFDTISEIFFPRIEEIILGEYCDCNPLIHAFKTL